MTKAAIRTSIALGLALLLGGHVAADTLPVVKVVTLASDTGAQAFYAVDKGFFTRAGLQVNVTVMNPSAITAAVASGTFDIGQSNVTALAAAREHGGPFVMLAPSSVFNIKLRPTAGILVAKNSPIKTARDFNGKTVAVSGLLAIAQVSVDAWVDKNGGDSSTVKFIEMPFSAMIPALASGRVDAIELAEPLLDEAEAVGQHSLSSGYDAIADQFSIGAWFCTAAYAAAHGDVIRRYATAMRETAHWANTHQSESAEILAKWTKLAVAPTMARVTYGETMNAAVVQPLIDASAKYKALRAPFPAPDMFAPGLPKQ